MNRTVREDNTTSNCAAVTWRLGNNPPLLLHSESYPPRLHLQHWRYRQLQTAPRYLYARRHPELRSSQSLEWLRWYCSFPRRHSPQFGLYLHHLHTNGAIPYDCSSYAPKEHKWWWEGLW